jgi:6-phosphogluconolactonase
MNKKGEMIVLKDASVLTEEAARRFVSLAQHSIASTGRFNVVLAGGTTPKAMYSLLATSFAQEVEWDKVYLFWGDERFVPHDNPDSTYLMVHDTLLKNVPIPAKNIFPVPTDGTIKEAASRYSKTLSAHFGNNLPRFDLVLLGMGTDGHTASLFPHSPTLISKDIVAVEYTSPKPPPQRITLTYPIINNAAHIMIMVTGADKADALREVLDGEHDPNKLPVQGVNPTNGKLLWLVDEKVAGKITTN